MATGMLLLPFVVGVTGIFYNSANKIGWLLSGGSLIALVAGVLASIQLNFRAMGIVDWIAILVLSFGGLRLFQYSLENFIKTCTHQQA